MRATLPLLQATEFPLIRRRRTDTLQVNLGYKCNQTCVHCHVNAGPNRTEMMSAETVDDVLAFVAAGGVTTLDVTGGAPELSPHFRRLVRATRAQGVRVIDRCNLTILFEPGQEDLADFLAEQGVEITASLPCYTEELVDRQRGKGVYETSVRALQRLNKLGYGTGRKDRVLNLVYNPQGPSLPPEQTQLQADYKRVLGESFGITFDYLFVIANMPIQRFGSMLVSKGQFNAYMQVLRDAYRPENLEQVMCRSLLSVDWQGRVYDCDFNQMLDLPLHRKNANGKSRPLLRELLGQDLTGHPIVIADHCFGCTAGQGSSCGGALS
jgi:radical SAM/Cys-rich protein